MSHCLKFALRWNLSEATGICHVVNGDIYERLAGLAGAAFLSAGVRNCTG
jgi:hypothetical protein